MDWMDGLGGLDAWVEKEEGRGREEGVYVMWRDMEGLVCGDVGGS